MEYQYNLDYCVLSDKIIAIYFYDTSKVAVLIGQNHSYIKFLMKHYDVFIDAPFADNLVDNPALPITIRTKAEQTTWKDCFKMMSAAHEVMRIVTH